MLTTLSSVLLEVPLNCMPICRTCSFAAFTNAAVTETAEEGPVAYIDSWYLQGQRPYVTEQVRTLRLDQHAHDWHTQILEKWNDLIDQSAPLRILWVTPSPPSLPFRERLGHLLLIQDIAEQLVPVHLSLHFAGLERNSLGFAAALLTNPVQFDTTRDLLQLARLCLARHCRLQLGDRYWQRDEAIPVSDGAGPHFLAGQPQDRVGADDLIEPLDHTTDITPDQPLPRIFGMTTLMVLMASEMRLLLQAFSK